MTKTNVFRRQALRAAVRIHEHLLGPARHAQGVVLPQAVWEELTRTVGHLQHAERKGWPAAIQSLIQELDYTALRVQREMELLRQKLSSRAQTGDVATASEIANELIALQNEFDDVTLDLQQHTVSVLTTAIELEGVQLGVFKISRWWPRIGQGIAYTCRALEPCRPEDHDGVTHPHVLDDHLCEGEGAAPIKAALTTGRIYDFFLLVRQILTTYNPGSAHAPLDDWYGGIPCHGCGCRMSEDDDCSCDQCDEQFCSDCS